MFQEYSDQSHILELSVHEICHARRLFRNVIVERCPAERKLLIETMIEDS